MSEANFTDSMEVVAVGCLPPDVIGGDACNGCPNNTCKSPGVLIDGLTRDAVKFLYQKCEVVPAGTIEKLAKLEASNAELLEALEAVKLYIDARQFYEMSQNTVNLVLMAIQREKGIRNE